jgi:hypothetical protein
VKAARDDSAESIRSRAVSMLRNDEGTPAEVAEVLEWIRQNDPSAAVRRIIATDYPGLVTANLLVRSRVLPHPCKWSGCSTLG